MSLYKQLKLAFPNLEFISIEPHWMYFDKRRKPNKIIIFKRDGCFHSIYRFKKFYIVSTYGIKHDVIIPLKESYKIFQILDRLK